MSRSLASIDAEIAAIEAKLPALIQSKSYTINGRGLVNQEYAALTARLDELHIQRDRLSGAAPTFIRTQVTGLR